MPKTVKTTGFILKKKNLLNKDCLFTLFSNDLGKIAIIAKGLKSITSRRAPHIQTGNLVDLELSLHNDMMFLQQSQLVSAFSQIRSSGQKTNYLFLYFFILDRILPERQQELPLYKVTQAFLFAMAREDAFSKEHITSHLNTLLTTAGYVQEPQTLSQLIRTAEEVINEKVPVNL